MKDQLSILQPGQNPADRLWSHPQVVCNVLAGHRQIYAGMQNLKARLPFAVPQQEGHHPFLGAQFAEQNNVAMNPLKLLFDKSY